VGLIALGCWWSPPSAPPITSVTCTQSDGPTLLRGPAVYARKLEFVAPRLPPDTRVLSIGIHPRSLHYSTLPDDFDEATLTALIERGNAALRDAGFSFVPCLVDSSPEAAEQQIRNQLQDTQFGLAMIGGGIRLMPENTELFERIVNVLHEVSPGIRLCFNTAPDNTVDALRRWITPRP
jgi:hypothetical protein